MSVKVKISDIVEGMDFQSEEPRPFLNTETGEVVFVSQSALMLAEDCEDYNHLPDWQQEEAEIAYDIIEHEEKYAELPSSFDIHEYDMMERFCYSLPDDNKRAILLNAIRGRGAFRRFKDKIITLGIREDWFAFRDDCYKQIAIDFCEQVQIDYVE